MRNIEVIKELSLDAYNFLQENLHIRSSDGRHELGNGVYVNIESYTTQARSERKFEAHKKYIDIQYMIEGEELITVCNTEFLKISDLYDSDKDIEFYTNELKGEDYSITPGEFIILKPGEAHMPCVCLNGIQKVRKAVFKIPVNV